MSSINEIRLGIAEFLGTSILNNSYIFLDRWTIVHFISGFILLFLIFKFFKKLKIYEKFALLFISVGFWELFELVMIYFGFTYKDRLFFMTEGVIGIVYDIIFGMLGGSIYLFFNEKINS